MDKPAGTKGLVPRNKWESLNKAKLSKPTHITILPYFDKTQDSLYFTRIKRVVATAFPWGPYPGYVHQYIQTLQRPCSAVFHNSNCRRLEVDPQVSPIHIMTKYESRALWIRSTAVFGTLAYTKSKYKTHLFHSYLMHIAQR